MGFYGKSEEQLHHENLDLLKHIKSRSLAPWSCIGDYNEILASEEKEGGHPKPIRLMNNFRSTLLHCGLIDLGFTGNMFTWNRTGGDDFVQLRLDRACAMVEWRSLFPQVRVSHLQTSYSDHVPILLTTHLANHQVLPKKFPRRFEEKWVTHPDCEVVIQQAWNHTVNTGSPMYRLFEKIKNCRSAPVRWSKITFGQWKNNLQEKHRILEELTREHTIAHLEEIRRVKDEINTILYHDELH